MVSLRRVSVAGVGAAVAAGAAWAAGAAVAGGGAGLDCGGGGGGSYAHPASIPRIAAAAWRRQRGAARRKDIRVMWLILLEALAAFAIGIAIVWWVMFAGRPRGERRTDDDEPGR